MRVLLLLLLLLMLLLLGEYYPLILMTETWKWGALLIHWWNKDIVAVCFLIQIPPMDCLQIFFCWFVKESTIAGNLLDPIGALCTLFLPAISAATYTYIYIYIYIGIYNRLTGGACSIGRLSNAKLGFHLEQATPHHFEKGLHGCKLILYCN